MYQKTTTVINKTGIHARPATCFVREASKFKCDITVKKEGCESEVKAKAIFHLLNLGLSMGTKITISANGEDEKEAVKTLVDLVNSGFGE